MRGSRIACAFLLSCGGIEQRSESHRPSPSFGMRVALENVVSVASVLLLTEATMTELPEPTPKAEATSNER